MTGAMWNQPASAQDWTETVEESLSEIMDAGNVACGHALLWNRNLDSLLEFQRVRELMEQAPDPQASSRPSLSQVFRLMRRASRNLHIMWSLRGGRGGTFRHSPSDNEEISQATMTLCVALKLMLCAWLAQRRLTPGVRAASAEIDNTLSHVKKLNQALATFDEVHKKVSREQGFTSGGEKKSFDALSRWDPVDSVKGEASFNGQISPAKEYDLHQSTSDSQSRPEITVSQTEQAVKTERDASRSSDLVFVKEQKVSGSSTERNVSDSSSVIFVKAICTVNTGPDKMVGLESNDQEQNRLAMTTSQMPKVDNTTSGHSSERESQLGQIEDDIEHTWRPGLGINKWMDRQQQNLG